MADPFRPNSKPQLLREAKIGLSIVAILLALLVYVAFYRISGRGRYLPDHIRDAPVAKLVSPNKTQKQPTNSGSDLAFKPQEIRDRYPIKSQSVSPNARESDETPRVAKRFSPTVIPDRQPESQIQSNEAASIGTRKVPAFKPETNRKKIVADLRPQSGIARVNIPEVATAKLAQNLHNSKPNQFASPFVDPVASIPDAKPAVLESEFKNKSGTKFESNLGAEVKSKLQLASLESLDPKPELPNAFKPTADNARFSPRPQNLKHAPKNSSTSDDTKDMNTAFPLVTENKPIEEAITTNALRLPVPGRRHVPSSKEPELAGDSKKAGVQGNSRRLESSSIESRTKQSGGFQVKVVPTEFQQVGQLKSDQVKLVGPKPILIPPARDESDLSFAKPLTNKIRTPDPLRSMEISAGQLATPSTFTKSDLPESYLVKQGDSYWSIAQSVYEDGRFFRALFKHNESTAPEFDVLVPGSLISTPSVSELVRAWPEHCPVSESVDVDRETASGPKYYVTRTGDTLFEIAGRQLDQASRYLEVVHLNQQILGSVQSTTPLQAGIKLSLPTK